MTADNAVIEVDLSGTLVRRWNGAGLTISGAAASGSTIEGLAINGFAYGLQLINGANGNTIAGNFIGTDATGTIGLGNSFYGIYVETASNTIGGSTPAAANLISANASDGILFVQATASGNAVLGNEIGPRASGTTALGNALAGVVIGDGPPTTRLAVRRRAMET